VTLRPDPIGPVPAETARVARAAFPHGSRYLQMRDALGTIFTDTDFAALYPARGRPVETPWRLALVTVMQFAEGLSDRQAAEAVRARIDWKYALGLDLTDPGFDFSVLSEFRARLIAGSAEHLLLDRLLAACTERGLLKARGRQRTDATHVLGALRVLSRLECVAETMRVALEAVVVAAPAWAQTHIPAAWRERYGRRIEEYRLPKGQAERQALATTVGADGLSLLAALEAAETPARLRELPVVALLRRVWDQQFDASSGQARLRELQDLPPATEQIETPHEPEARYGVKRGQGWTGYKVHLTETCDDARPHLVTQVATTLAPEADVEQLAPIQEDLARKALLPFQHLVDAGYVRGSNLVRSHDQHGIDLVGPMAEDHQWQAKAGTGFDLRHFQIDWEGQAVTCPRGRRSVRWCETTTARQRTMIGVTFAATDCTPCPVREQCTRAKTLPRSLTLQPRAEHEAIQAARDRQQTEGFPADYARRAGIEGTLSQGVRACGLRTARYRGLAKTHLQQVATAAALNVQRVTDWLDGQPRATTRRSHLTRLAPAA
jgi:transposase